MPAIEVATPGVAEACPQCGGRGWVVEPDGGAGLARRCRCIAAGRVDRFRVGTSRLKPTRATACHLTRPVACFHSPRIASLVVIDADGGAEVIADGR